MSGIVSIWEHVLWSVSLKPGIATKQDLHWVTRMQMIHQTALVALDYIGG